MRMPTVDISPARRFTVYGRFTLFYAGKDGIPLLKGTATLRDINGFLVQTRKHRVSVVFKRHSPFGL